MLFKDLTIEELSEKINKLGLDGINPARNAFYFMTPKQDKSWRLKQEYKPNESTTGIGTVYELDRKAETQLVAQAHQNLAEKNFLGSSYEHSEAALKLHVSINNIGEVDEQVILGLIKLIKEESESPNSALSVPQFKIITPSVHDHARFNMNDQFTIYFDKYSSAADLRRLASKINTYLKQHIPKNEQPLGPKDSFGFNTFVSARFDTNKLLAQYNIYPFFDLEIQKFFKNHTKAELEQFPICALEVIFNFVITSKDITIPKQGEKKGLSIKDSVLVQAEFKKILKNPKEYMEQAKNNPNQASLDKKEQQAKKKIINHFQTAEQINLEVENYNNLYELRKELAIKRTELEKLMEQPDIKQDFDKFDSGVFLQYENLLENKEKLFNEAINTFIKQQQTKTVCPPTLNPNAVQIFENLLLQLKQKSEERMLLGANKKQYAKDLHTNLSNAFNEYKQGINNYDSFKTTCYLEIKTTMPYLAVHRGLKELLVNLWEAIKTLGGLLNNEDKPTQHGFFKVAVKTDSELLVDKFEEPIENLKDESNPGQGNKG